MKDTLVATNSGHLHEVEKVQLVSRTVSEIESSKIKIPDEEVKKLLARLKSKLTAYQALDEPVRRSKHTDQLKEADEIRDADVTMLFSMIRTYRSSKRANEQDAYKSLYALIKGYKDLSSRNYEEETGFIARLLTQLKSDRYSSDVATLNLTQLVARLTESQTQFETLFTARVKSELAKPKVNYKQLRDELFYEYQRFCVHIDSLVWVRGTEVYIKLLDIINKARSYFAEVVRKRQSRHKKQVHATTSKGKRVDVTASTTLTTPFSESENDLEVDNVSQATRSDDTTSDTGTVQSTPSTTSSAQEVSPASTTTA